MTPVTLIMAYYENAGMLAEHYRLIRMLPPELRAQLRVIVVDDGSPTAPAAAEDVGASLQVYRMKVDVRWNQDACRNVGVRHAETDWVLMTDMDHIVPRGTWAALMSGRWDNEVAYSFARVSAPDETPYKPHPNSWFLSKWLFEKVGGYDERFAGYYGTDGDFKVRLLREARRHTQLPEYLIRVPRSVIPDASTTTYQRKEPQDRPTVDRLRIERDKTYDGIRRYKFPYERVA